MKDFCGYVHATNGELVTFTGCMKEWEDRSEYDRKFIVETLANLIIEDTSIHHRPVDFVCATIAQR